MSAPSPGPTMLRQSAANLVLQGLTLVSKSLLLFVMARFLDVAEVGVFGLVAVTLGIALHLAGLEFHAFNAREILARDAAAATRLIRDQLAFHAASYGLVVPATLLVFLGGVLPWELLALFLPLLAAEHAAQELQRVLFVLSRPVAGAKVALVRGGLWIYVATAVLALEPGGRTLMPVLALWLAGSLAAIALAAWWLRDLPWAAARGVPIDRRWIVRGLSVSLPLLVASLAYRLMLSIDRYVLQAYHGEAAVGVFTLYASVRNAIQGFLEFGAIFILRPRIVAAWQRGDTATYRRLMRRLAAATVALSVLLCAGAALLIVPVLSLIGEPLYRRHLDAYAVLLAAAVVAGVAELPHTALYARGRDRAIIGATLIGLAAAVALNLWWVPRLGVLGAALASLTALAVTALAKALAATAARGQGP
ncbi:MAG TPA: polysaccharide biosynthesis C-terminal domain-containing protein [Thermoanaerobaculia bacterium]|nr:polysaccharide biosynthesis C-terminal domain-containing protein [Thermoanaerobaculia bacterium]